MKLRGCYGLSNSLSSVYGSSLAATVGPHAMRHGKVEMMKRDKVQSRVNQLMASANACKVRGDTVGCKYFFDVAKALCAGN